MIVKSGKSVLTAFISYAVLVLIIFLLNSFFQWSLALSVSATIMLLVPFVLRSNYNYFDFKLKNFLKGLLISVIIVLIYIAVLRVYSHYSDKGFGFDDLSLSFILIQLLLIAIPEEIFFRGFLQREFGNNIKAVVLVSFLFALAHLITVCGTGKVSFSGCNQNALTFFPSLVMGYLYISTGTLWSSIAFHFLANITHILMKVS